MGFRITAPEQEAFWEKCRNEASPEFSQLKGLFTHLFRFNQLLGSLDFRVFSDIDLEEFASQNFGPRTQMTLRKINDVM